jgi:drug/metabolite transporter (DMT)-like permease
MVLKEPITSKKVFGVLLGASGAVFIVLASHQNQTGVSSLWGNLLVFSTTITYAAYLVLMKPLTAAYGIITLMKWIFLYGTLTTLPFCYRYIYIQPGADTMLYWGILYTTVGATFLTYLLVPVALKILRPTIVGMYNYAQPVIASFVAFMVGQDRFSWDKPLSLMLVVAGVYLVILSKSRAQVLAEKAEQGHA